MNILITSAGQRVSLVRAFQKELKMVYPTAKVFTTDMNPGLSAACNVSDGYFKIRRVTDTEYIPDLLALCKKENVGMIIPTIDTELLVLAQKKALFTDAGVNLIISSKEFVSICRDKRKSAEFFRSHSINVPKEIDKDNPSFPLFIKPFDGSLSVDTFIIETKEQLTEYHLTNDRLLFMEYIQKADHDEFTVDMYYGRDNLVKCIVPRKRIWVRAGEVNKALTFNNVIVGFLKEKLGKIEGAIGCLTVQVFLNKLSEKIIGIEINPRFGGGYPLSYKAGANFPKWLIREYYFNESINYTDNWENNLLMLRYDDEVLVHDFISEK
ncbi:MAG: ATP-grasp domain-containing protein [Bacteroidota bacterium]|nr:ATP-grasp domain-containing protein [Bacteroidota bacterium]